MRFKTPLEGQTVIHDLIWGDVIFSNSTIEDLVLLKSDGYPTYHLANIVDDHDMLIGNHIDCQQFRTHDLVAKLE